MVQFVVTMMLCTLLFLHLSVKPAKSNELEFDKKIAHNYYDTAFNIAKQTGDFWVAEKLLQAAACLDTSNSRYIEALGDVEMKLGRPGEALVAWQRAARLEPRFTPQYNKRLNEMKHVTSPSRWKQAIDQTRGVEWKCQDYVSSSPLGDVPKPYSNPLHLFSTPIEVINITAFRQHHGLNDIDIQSVVETAFKGYKEANEDGPLVDEIHGELTPNNQFFEYQMALLNEATVEELDVVMVGWRELGALQAWKELVGTVRQALQESSLFSSFLPQSCKQGTSASGTIGECSNQDNLNINGYGWISMHKDASTHVKHAHLDARLSVVYYAQLPVHGKHKIVFYDPRGLSPHQNLRLPNDLLAPPFTETFSHYPHPGDLVIFPSWLVHEVVPVEIVEKELSQDESLRESMFEGHAEDYRVSISFNIGEGWHGSAPSH